MKINKVQIKKIVPLCMHKTIGKTIRLFRKQYKKSYAQCGEDLILDIIFNNTKKGIFIDVGANHPTKSNNTYFFYKKGWSGINIDALPGSMGLFNVKRKRDVNLEFPVGDEEKTMNYYMYKESSYNSFVENDVDFLQSLYIGTKQLQTKKLSWILDTYLSTTHIDFITIDVEGMDFKVLKSNNWGKYRPNVIILESLAYAKDREEEAEVSNFLNEKGYSWFCCTPTNVFYIENDFKKYRFNDGN